MSVARATESFPMAQCNRFCVPRRKAEKVDEKMDVNRIMTFVNYKVTLCFSMIYLWLPPRDSNPDMLIQISMLPESLSF